ncbi:cytochrome C [Geobacter sp. DSM 9736]|uniref:cytochrome C n=1 Tax=Geobacter sp. DSM 9736 TaxID=1277350 RepID=UPI000B5DF43D|nr:cytochrome C [Geobacter sp. DSM 9736]SNB45517.1 hypothetical protein SAMN06269301_0935 [Geobacter sp. DSM 9736]
MKKLYAILGITMLMSVAANAQETTWSGNIRDIVERKCNSCHGAESAPEYQLFKREKDTWLAKGQGMRMDSYSHLVSFVGWPNTGALMRRLDDGKSSKEGKAGNMHQYLGATEEERQKNLTIFKAWVGNWSLKRWPDSTKEELNGIKVKY